MSPFDGNFGIRGENMGQEREIYGDRQFDFNYEVKRVNAADRPRPACVRFLCLFLETDGPASRFPRNWGKIQR